ncbi:M24 family metallopeptidase [bacterium]|nr:M24 family metallopeptidase [bacterium]
MKQPSIKTPEQIQNITDSCKYLTEMLYYLREHTKAGMKLIEVEQLSQEWLDQRNLKGAFKNYDGFPANLCLSVNDCVVHGIPDDTILAN